MACRLGEKRKKILEQPLFYDCFKWEDKTNIKSVNILKKKQGYTSIISELFVDYNSGSVNDGVKIKEKGTEVSLALDLLYLAHRIYNQYNKAIIIYGKSEKYKKVIYLVQEKYKK